MKTRWSPWPRRTSGSATLRRGCSRPSRRPGRPADRRTGAVMAGGILPDAVEQALAWFAELAEGRWEAARRTFTATLRSALVTGQLAAVWAQLIGSVGAYQGVGEPYAYLAGDF